MKFYGVANTDIGNLHLFSTLEKAKEYIGEDYYVEPWSDKETFWACDDEYWIAVIDTDEIDTAEPLE